MGTFTENETTAPAEGARAEADLAIEARGLTKRFGHFIAVDQLDLCVPTGTVMSLLGPNGSGKTTTVRMLATLLKPDGGSAKVNGHDILHEARAVRASISLTGQFAALDPYLTARENLRLMARLRGRSRGEAIKVAEELLERFDATEFQGRLIKQLSGGQKRRIDLAAGLIDPPRLLVLDEPTTGLDPRSRQAVWRTIRELVQDGITLLLTTQYLEEADALADHIVVIDHGREIAAGTPTELKSHVGDQRVEVIAVDKRDLHPIAEQLRAAGFDTTVVTEERTVSVPAPNELDDLNTVSRVIAESNIGVSGLGLRSPTLDDAFLALTGRTAEGEAENDDLRA